MARVAVVTDSSACLPSEMASAHGIITVPLVFLFDGEVYEDGSMSAHEFFERLRTARRFPTTAAPAPAAFLEAFRKAKDVADSVLCITLPSSYSGTYSSARNAAELARTELPDLPVRVVDSGCLAMCHGFAVLAAARAARRGESLDGVEAAARRVRESAYLIGVIDTMRFLAKSGRVPLALHWAASLLNVKPVLAAEGETVHAIARVRTRPRAMERLLERIEGRLTGAGPHHVAVMHADAPAPAEELAGRIRERYHPDELLVTEFTSVMGAHTGPGFVGVALFSGEDAPP